MTFHSNISILFLYLMLVVTWSTFAWSFNLGILENIFCNIKQNQNT